MQRVESRSFRTLVMAHGVLVLCLAVAAPAAADDFVPWEASRSEEPEPLGQAAPIADPDPAGEEGTPEDGSYPILDRRVVSEELVEETTEITGAAALAPGTYGNAPQARSNHRPSPGVGGSIGLPHLPSAQVGVPGSLRLGLTGEVFGARDFLVAGDRASRQSITFAAGYTPTSWLEAYTSVAFLSVSNTHASPQLMQVQGDFAFGAKAAWPIFGGLSLGTDLGVAFFPRLGALGVGAAGFVPKGLATFDFRDELDVPLLSHFEIGFVLDGTGQLPGGRRLHRVEEFALGIYQYNRFALGLGVEAPLPIVTPFLAWRMRAPMGEVTVPLVRDPDGTVRPLTYGEVVSNILSLGARVTALRDVSVSATLDLGLSGAAVDGLPATMPWNLLFGVSYVLDPLGGGERITRVVERTIEVDRAVPPPPATGWVAGVVRDQLSNEPLDAAVITLSGDGVHPVATGEAGRFRTHELSPGEVEVTVSREGYRPVTQVARISAGEAFALDFVLERAVTPGLLTLSVVGGEEKGPVPATVRIQGAESRELRTDDEGRLETALSPGEYVLNISAEGFLTRQRNLKVAEGDRLIADLELAAEPEEALVTMGDGKLELSRQVHFQTGRSEILPDSYQILDQVIDLIARHDIERIRVEGHTDNQGSRAVNMRLSRARAAAVRTYLIEQGISEDRIESDGFGPERPIAPNLTARGRAMNRRVEFHVLGQKVEDAE
jgi:OmpA-OmpF porin, OOP family